MSKHKKIALVTLDYPPERGGVARYLGNLVEHSQGQMDVFVNETHETHGPGKVEAVRLVRKGFWAWYPMISFFRGLKKRGYDQALISHVIPVGTAAYISSFFGGISYSVLLHGLDLRLAVAHPRKKWLLKCVLRKARCVFTNSTFVADEVRGFDQTLDPITLTPGVDQMVFPDRVESRNVYSVREDQFVVLAVTRLVPRKGLDVLIRSLAFLPEFVVVTIAGDGADFERLEHEAVPFADRVRFIRSSSDMERNMWYAAADCFVMPVRDKGSDVEGFGIVFLEAALAGLPVIAGNAGGAKEAVVDGETGFLVDPLDANLLAERILQISQDKELAQRFGQAGQKRARQDFQWKDRWVLLQKSIWP